jgi:hypothetical protein
MCFRVRYEDVSSMKVCCCILYPQVPLFAALI